MIRTGRSAGEREYATLVAELRAVEEDVRASRGLGRESVTPHLTFHHDTHAAPRGERIAVKGGAIAVRPVERSDRAQLAAGFRQLGAMTRLRSVREPARSLTEEQLDALTDLDHVSREVLIAQDAATGDAIGLGRYERDPRDPRRAEFSCTVTDAWQRRGVGAALVDRLAAQARAAGIEQFVARVVVGDAAGHRLLARVADHITEHRDGGVVTLRARPTSS